MLLALLAPSAAWLTPGTARGHGAAPAALGILALDDEGPSLIRLTEGAARRGPGGWEWLCQSHWGGVPDTPLGIDATPGAAWLAGADDLYLIDDGGFSEAQALPDLSALAIRGFTAAGSTRFALTQDWDAGISSIWFLSASGHELRYETEQRLHSLAGRGQQLVAARSSAAGDLWLLQLDNLGNLIQELPAGLIEERDTPLLRGVGERLFLLRVQPGLYRLEEWDGLGWLPLLESEEPIHGPVQGPDGLYLSDSLELFRLGDTGSEPESLYESDIRCLTSDGETVWGCLFPDLVELTPDGPAETAFALGDLGDPVFERLDEDGAQQCQLEWIVWAGDLGRDPFPDPEPEPETGCGCPVTPQPADSAWLPLLLLPLPLLRRRRS